MSLKFKILACILCSFSFGFEAHAYKYVIITDQADPKKSEEVIELFKNTYPFNTFSVEFEILKVDGNKLDCDSHYGIESKIGCKNGSEIQSMAQERGADQVMVVKELSKYGGSSAVGGGYPVITTSSDARVMIHEYLHTLGLCDEYKFKPSEAKLNCGTSRNTPNLAYIKPEDYYSSDSDARRKHMWDIPWFSSISRKTLITNSNQRVLGTDPTDPNSLAAINTARFPMAINGQANQIGLYRAGVCDNATPPVPTWKPEGIATVMSDISAGLGAHAEKTVDKILLSKGIKKKLDNEVPRNPEVVVQSQSQTHAEVGSVSRDIVNADPDQTVNNSSRGFFKSFFAWVGDLIRQIGNAMTR
ncbi:MAG: hypothetical protein HOP07_11825 [Bacteriovoracaceae bacterium]|nr:hypothetical protein [Bacteriovoracaceae bacterium]